jgi:hypothetical protein
LYSVHFTQFVGGGGQLNVFGNKESCNKAQLDYILHNSTRQGHLFNNYFLEYGITYSTFAFFL